MCSRDLPDMYALSPRALGIRIRQIPHAHVTTITYNHDSVAALDHSCDIAMVANYNHKNVHYFVEGHLCIIVTLLSA